MSSLIALFGWPSGGILQNLIASAMTTAIAMAYTHWRVSKVHQHLREQTQELKAHVEEKLG